MACSAPTIYGARVLSDAAWQQMFAAFPNGCKTFFSGQTPEHVEKWLNLADIYSRALELELQVMDRERYLAGAFLDAARQLSFNMEKVSALESSIEEKLRALGYDSIGDFLDDRERKCARAQGVKTPDVYCTACEKKASPDVVIPKDWTICTGCHTEFGKLLFPSESCLFTWRGYPRVFPKPDVPSTKMFLEPRSQQYWWLPEWQQGWQDGRASPSDLVKDDVKQLLRDFSLGKVTVFYAATVILPMHWSETGLFVPDVFPESDDD